MQRPPLCLSCGVPDPAELRASPALVRLSEWQDLLSDFWGSHEWAFVLLRAPLLLLGAAVALAFTQHERDLAVVPALAFALLWFAKEFFPLAPVPFNLYNVVTSRLDAYSTAGVVVLAGAALLAALALFLAVVERLGNVAAHATGGYKPDGGPSYWSAEPVALLSMMVLGLPLLYFGALVLHTRFVGPRVARQL